MDTKNLSKSEIRTRLRQQLSALPEHDRHRKSAAACALVTGTPEFDNPRVVMLFLSTREEVDTAPLALRCWQEGKTVVVPKVAWDQRRMLPTEITSFQTDFTTTGPGIREPVSGKPIPVPIIDLVIVPGLGFTPQGFRIGRGMGFYDRFLAQADFTGVSCGLGFEEQLVSDIPVLEHDARVALLVTDQRVRRFASHCIKST